MSALVEARDVHLSFGPTPALRGATLEVAQGEILAVMGPSGSGKSTLLHCLAGILVPELTAAENVALPLLLGGERRATALVRARAWFERLALAGLEERRSGELSGGEQQRIALARGLVGQPEVLFADEPTGSLDSLTGERVMDLLTAAAREHGITVVLVTHEPRVAAYADREVIVRDGKVTSPASLVGAR